MVTILIIAHEEEEKLSRNLPFLLSQQCTDYEVVVVDMNSEDNTIEILNALEAEHRHLRHISLPKSAKDITAFANWSHNIVCDKVSGVLCR